MPLDDEVATRPAAIKPACDRPHPLDRPIARFAAVAVAFLAVGALVYIHRKDFLPVRPPSAEEAAADPFLICMGSRRGDIAKMKADGVIQQAQADQFLQRAEAMCRSEAAKAGGSGPVLPGLAPPAGGAAPPAAYQPARSF